tara:strand:- start:65 stop:829 length:765 start_codon:yes stop_codon:yes gene_type:complete
MKRIAIELFGQLRMWDIQDSLSKLETFFNKEGFSVDFFGTFWNDEYTNSYVDKGAFEHFKSLQLLQEPNFDRYTLKKYFYSLKESVRQRKEYQSKQNINYEFVIQSRPDLEFIVNDTDSPTQLKELMILLKKYTDTSCVFTKVLDNQRVDDKFILGNELAANKLGDSFDKCSDFRYHHGLYYATKKLVEVIDESTLFFGTDLYRHKIQQELNFDDDKCDISCITPTNNIGFIRDYLKDIQDTNELISEMKRLKK